MTASDYERGKRDGGIEEQLAEHRRHFIRINGSIEDMVRALAALTLEIRQLAQAADSDRATVITTAVAVEKADAARRAKSETTWTPWQRGLALLAGLATLVGLLVLLRRS